LSTSIERGKPVPSTISMSFETLPVGRSDRRGDWAWADKQIGKQRLLFIGVIGKLRSHGRGVGFRPRPRFRTRWGQSSADSFHQLIRGNLNQRLASNRMSCTCLKGTSIRSLCTNEQSLRRRVP
jgi:hypothetical protein